MAAALRHGKARIALATALADIEDRWSLEQVTGTLSSLADAALRAATRHLLLAAHQRGELRLPHPGAPDRGSGFVVLALGKLGAGELNYSSDIDLLLLHDGEPGPVYPRLARELVALLSARDADGYVFRMDLRLRPDPAATPPAVALAGALAYYEGLAQTWERAALIKARPVAGDLALGQRFLEAIRPAIWRRHLDFAAIAEIHDMKQRIDRRAGARSDPEALAGRHLKLGRGGIREIEFCTQALQLVWGGRNPALRTRATLPALAALAGAGHLPAFDAAALANAYRFLRRVEHRLQMVDDRQTHSLPETDAEISAFARFLGYSDPLQFAAEARAQLAAAHLVFSGLFQSDAPRREALPEWQGTGEPPWDAWLAGRPRALRSERGRVLLRELLPALLAALRRQPDADAALRRFDELLYRLPAGVPFLATLQHNPGLVERLAEMLGAAPSLADHLAQVPSALDGLLSPEPIGPDPGPALEALLGDARGLDDALALATRFVRAEEFRLATAELAFQLDADRAGEARAALADAAIVTLLPRVLRQHQGRYGSIPGGGMVVVALGKAGSREMMAGSDLDLLLIYDGEAESTGTRSLPATQYYARAAQAVVASLTVPTRDGPLYAVDMRLRPSGRAGPVAVSLAAFAQYHHADAWVWERLALTRARVVAGPRALRARVAGALREALRQGDPAHIVPETVSMRARLLRDLPASGPWDAKLRPGGLIDVEFTIQALQLLHAGDKRLLTPEPRQAARRLAAAGHLPASDAARLIEADRIWRGVQSLLRIMHGRAVPAAVVSPALDKLWRVCGMSGAPAEPALLARLDLLAAEVRAIFTRHLGEIGP